MTRIRLFAAKAGAKNGRPWIWSQCVWEMRMLASIGREPNSFVKSAPRLRIPVPASRIRISLPARTSIHEVLPPYRAVVGPGEGVEPRTPRNRIFIEGKSDLEVIGLKAS